MADVQKGQLAGFVEIQGLSADERSDLLSLVDAARKQERDGLDVAIAKVIKVLPVLVRGPAKKIMFGGRHD